MRALYDYATARGVQVEYRTDLDPRHPGLYCHGTSTIELLDGMNRVKMRSVLAHELGHAHYGHEPSMFPHVEARQERQADEWAAHFLINEREYRLAEERYGANTEWIAQELEVLERLVIAYERTLHRVGDSVYVSPKMGAGQWSAKVSA